MTVQSPESYQFGEFRIDLVRRLLLRNGEPISLTPKVFETLLHLVRNRGKVVAKDDLMAAVWPDTVVEENNLNQNISTLRRTLGETRGENRYIATVPGTGYRFVADVLTALPEADPPPYPQLTAVAPESASGSRWWLVPVSAGLAVIVAIAAGFSYHRRRSVPNTSAAVRSLAVLPFRPLVPASHDEALEMGIADTLIARLSSLNGVTVRPLEVIRKFVDPSQDPAAIGRDLQVNAVLDGSIEKNGERVRVTVRLLRSSDGRQLWSSRYDEQAQDIFSVEDAISERVAGELALNLTSQEQAQLRKRYTSDPAAYDLYLRGNYFWEKRTREATQKAIDYFKQSLARDPNYALAYVGLANCYSAMPISSDVPPLEAFPKATNAALRALEIDPSLPEAHVTLAYIHFFFDWDWDGARTEYRKAIEINPNNPGAHWGYALLLSSLGQNDQGIAEIDKALQLEPVLPMTGALKGHILYQARRYSDAENFLQKTLELDDHFWITHIEMGKIYESEGRYDEALKSFRAARNLSGGVSETLSLIGYTEARSGHRAQAEESLKELSAMADRAYVPPYHFALLYHGLGNTNETLTWLARARQGRDVHMVFLGVDPKWDDLRSDPRFTEMLRSMRF